jgi:predicted transcriptional regulator
LKNHAQKKAAVLSTLKFAPSRVTAQEIADKVGIIEMHSTCVGTRGIIRDLIEDGYAIGSNAAGYKLLRTGKDVQSYLNSLLKRQMGISKRIANVYEAAKLDGLL